jgi:hypothetical protein
MRGRRQRLNREVLKCLEQATKRQQLLALSLTCALSFAGGFWKGDRPPDLARTKLPFAAA